MATPKPTITMLLKPTFNLSPYILKTLITTTEFRLLKPLNHRIITQFPFSTVANDGGAILKKTYYSPVTNKQYPHLQMSGKAEKRASRESPSGKLLYLLGRCSKDNDTNEALRLYEDALNDNAPLNVEHYNKLLYLCSASDGELCLKKRV